jgi:integrase
MTRAAGAAKLRGRRGDGSLSERAPGVWRLRVFAGTDALTKRPHQVTRTFRGTKTGATKALREFVAAVTADSGERQAAPPSRHITVRALLEDEWSQHLKRLGRAATTLETYAIVVSTHLVPGLGNIPLAKLTPRDIDHYYATKAEAGMAPATIRQHGAILSSALSLAVDWDLIPTNPCAKAHLPEKAPSTRNAPSQAQVRKLVDACGDDVDLATAVILAAITGARRGELCGLQWLDVDWDMGILRIERQRVPVTGGDATVPTKTKQVRRIALGPGGLEVLRRYSAALDERAAALEIKRPANGWLLSYDCGCTPMRAKSLGAKITGLGKAIDAPVTTHLLRYFAATEMVGAGVDPRTVAGRLGHTPEMLLRVYASFLPQRDLEAATGLERKVLEP